MASTVINTREDLDATTGTPEHVAFMALLAGTLWRLEKDDTAQAWVAIEDNSTIERFSFTRADFPDAQPPALPEYVPEVVAVPEVVSRAKGKIVLIRAGLWQSVLDYVAAITDPVQKAIAEVALHDAPTWRRDSPFVAAISSALGVTEEQMDQLFIATQEVVL